MRQPADEEDWVAGMLLLYTSTVVVVVVGRRHRHQADGCRCSSQAAIHQVARTKFNGSNPLAVIIWKFINFTTLNLFSECMFCSEFVHDAADA